MKVSLSLLPSSLPHINTIPYWRIWSRENIPLSFVIYLMDLDTVFVALVFEKTGMIHLQYEIEHLFDQIVHPNIYNVMTEL